MKRRYPIAVLLTLVSLAFPDSDILTRIGKLNATPRTIATPNPTILMVTSMVWSGTPITGTTIDYYNKLRRSFPNLKIIHFISSKYFLETEKDENIALFRTLIDKHDNAGMYIAPWSSLLDLSNIKDRSSSQSSFWGSRPPAQKSDWGVDTFIETYTQNELDTLIENSRDLAAESDLIDPSISMIAGWSGSQDVVDSMVKAGVEVDFSPVNPYPMHKRLSNYPIFKKITKYWSHITVDSGPLVADSRSGGLLRIPQNFGSLDYLGSHWVEQSIERVIRNTDEENKIMQFTLFSDTLDQSVPKFLQILNKAVKISRSHTVKLVSTSVPHKKIKLN